MVFGTTSWCQPAASCQMCCREFVGATGEGLHPVERVQGDGGVTGQRRAGDGVAGEHTVSLRTVRRMMSDLMERLAAQSRFQAGVNAAKRGWI